MKKLLSLLVMFSLLLSGAALAEEGEVIELRFQRIGNDNRQCTFVYCQLVWQSDFCRYQNPLIFSLIEVGGKDRIQHRRATPADVLLFIQPFCCSI